MILSDKIIRLRKRNGWSQEELAEKMNVSRQAVSKWESAQAVPDLEKILRLGALFGVTTDYLLKDELEEETFTEDGEPGVTRVTLAQANAFLVWRQSASVKIAAAVFLCICAVIPLLILGAVSELPDSRISELLACGAGLAALLVLVAAAVAVFLYCGSKNAPYAFLDTEPFETEYGVAGMVRERQKAYKSTYVKSNIAGACLCILASIPLFIGSLSENELLLAVTLAITLLLAGVGVVFFLIAGIRWASMEKLLKEGEFSPAEKRKSKIKESVGTIYWLGAAAIYLAWSFTADNWRISWVLWPVAGVLFAAVMILCDLLIDRHE